MIDYVDIPMEVIPKDAMAKMVKAPTFNIIPMTCSVRISTDDLHICGFTLDDVKNGFRIK